MSDFEDIQRLIRLKRHERPPAEFVEQFVSTFQERQRSEMLRNSARVLLWERVSTYFEGLLNPKWAWAGATAVAVFGLGFMLRPVTTGAGQLAQNKQSSVVIGPHEADAAREAINRGEAGSFAPGFRQNLISQHYHGGLGDEQLYTGQIYAAGFSVDVGQQRR